MGVLDQWRLRLHIFGLMLCLIGQTAFLWREFLFLAYKLKVVWEVFEEVLAVEHRLRQNTIKDLMIYGKSVECFKSLCAVNYGEH